MTAGSVFDQDASRKLEATYQTPDVVAQRAATLHALALQVGERVVDIGSGPGLLAAEMAAQVGPAGKVVGLDLSDSMLALSRERCGDLPTNECPSFLKADAARLPFADSMFDWPSPPRFTNTSPTCRRLWRSCTGCSALVGGC
jgi:arsenite methyltransferase